MRILISNGTLVNEGRSFKAHLLIDDEHIAEIIEGEAPRNVDRIVDATGCFVLPGVIDDHVHFREPGMTTKADIESESRAAAYGGVTSFFDMPNTIPQTTTLEALDDKFSRGAEKSHVNYSFFFGATNDNYETFKQLDQHRIPGIKLFMGSSTGNMLVDRREALENIFRSAEMPIMAHCEDTDIINKTIAQYRKSEGDDAPIYMHQLLRSEEACFESTSLAVALAKTFGTRLHVAHVSTARELELFGKYRNITAEAVIAHLWFTNRDYDRLGALIKCNPSVKAPKDRDALREALLDGRITTVGTDHAPHLLSEKQGGALKAVSGMPMVQFSLVAMLELVNRGILTIERLVELMCHNPATLFEVRRRGFLRTGYWADVTVVRPNSPWTVTKDVIQSRCGWSPMEGEQFRWRVEHTFCNGNHIYDNGKFDAESKGRELVFR